MWKGPAEAAAGFPYGCSAFALHEQKQEDAHYLMLQHCGWSTFTNWLEVNCM